MSLQYPWFLALIPVLLWLFRRKQARTSVTVDAIVATHLEPGRARYLWLADTLKAVSPCSSYRACWPSSACFL